MIEVLSLSEIAAPDPSGGMVLHGTAVALEGQGVLFFGPSGSGKSQAGLALMAFGAQLVVDDRVLITEADMLAAPDGVLPMIEARGVGLLSAQLHGPVPLALAVDLARAEPDRLPPSRYLDCFQAKAPLILAKGHPNLAPVLLQALRKGRAR